MSTEKDKRLQVSLKTAKSGFDEVVAVSQRAINTNLDYLLKLYPELGEVNINGHNGTMTGQLSSGKISLHIVDNNRGMVDYYCNFKSGKVSVWDDDIGTEGDFSPDIDMAGWVFAFGVSLGSINLDDGTDESNEIRGVINQPGDYSISRLYLDFNTHQIASFNKNASSFGSHTFTENTMNSFVSIMLKWGSNMNTIINTTPKKGTIGYALNTANPETVNVAAPTFPPTSFRFQNYEYIAPGSSTPTDGAGAKGDNNVLCYLEMTENRPLPVELLTYSGNFVTPDMDGTIVISRGIFLDRYLLKTSEPVLLNILNRYTYAWIAGNRNVQPHTEYYDPKKNLNVGPGSPDDSTSGFFNWQQVSGSNTKWEWKKSLHTDDDPSEVRLQYWAETSNTMEVKPGTNQLVLSGSTKIGFKSQYWPWYLFGGNMGTECYVTTTWTINITLNSVMEGGLEISLNLPSNTGDVFVTPEPYFDEWPFPNLTPSYGKSMRKSMKERVTATPLGQVASEVQASLASTARFVVPGGGTFFYKNPIFNNNGNVMIESRYNGVDLISRMYATKKQES